MSDYVPTLNASDSGFLNSLHGPHGLGGPRRGVDSRVGDAPNVGDSPDINKLLRDVAVPPGLQDRLKQLLSDD